MTDMELAEEIGKACTEARADMFVSWLLERLIQDPFARPKVKQDATTALAALRRGPEPFMLDCLAGKLTTWEAICGYVSKLELQLAERPPSGEMVVVPRELTPAMHEAGLRFAGTLHANYEDCWKAMLAASGASFVLRVSTEKLKEIQDEFTSRIIEPEVKP